MQDVSRGALDAIRWHALQDAACLRDPYQPGGWGTQEVEPSVPQVLSPQDGGGGPRAGAAVRRMGSR